MKFHDQTDLPFNTPNGTDLGDSITLHIEGFSGVYARLAEFQVNQDYSITIRAFFHAGDHIYEHFELKGVDDLGTLSEDEVNEAKEYLIAGATDYFVGLGIPPAAIVGPRPSDVSVFDNEFEFQMSFMIEPRSHYILDEALRTRLMVDLSRLSVFAEREIINFYSAMTNENSDDDDTDIVEDEFCRHMQFALPWHTHWVGEYSGFDMMEPHQSDGGIEYSISRDLIDSIDQWAWSPEDDGSDLPLFKFGLRPILCVAYS